MHTLAGILGERNQHEIDGVCVVPSSQIVLLVIDLVYDSVVATQLISRVIPGK